MHAHAKSLALLGFAAVAFVPFCFALSGFLLQASTDITAISWMGFLGVFGFFLIALTGVVFAAVVQSSYWFSLIALLFPVLFGQLVFGAAVPFLLTFGLPFAFVFLVVKRTIGNRVHIHFSTDVRRPVTTAYVILFFFAAFAVAPFADEVIRTHAAEIATQMVPQEMEIGGERVELTASMQDLIAAEIEQQLAVCNGNAQCEEQVRTAIIEQVEAQLEGNPLLGGIDAESERPLTADLIEKYMNDLENSAFIAELEANGIPVWVVWALLIFLIISPFAILFSFASVLFMAVMFDLLKIFRIFRVEKQNVRQDIIC